MMPACTHLVQDGVAIFVPSVQVGTSIQQALHTWTEKQMCRNPVKNFGPQQITLAGRTSAHTPLHTQMIA